MALYSKKHLQTNIYTFWGSHSTSRNSRKVQEVVCKNGCSCPHSSQYSGAFSRWLGFPSHQEVEPISPSFESGFGHGTFFSQLDLRKCDMRRELKTTCEWGLPSPAVGDPSATMNKSGLDPWRMRDQMGRGPMISAVPVVPDTWVRPS